MDVWKTIASERRALADQLEVLSPAQWDSQSLCGAWTIGDVAAHLIVPHEVSIPSFLSAFIAARGSFDRANVALTAKAAKRAPTDLVSDLRRYADRHTRPPGFGPGAPLTEVLVHGQDIRIPLGLQNDRAVVPWAASLDFLVTPKARRGFVSRPLHGLRLVASDLDWAHGHGEEVHGPAVALALAIMGRNARSDELAGPGASRLAGRGRG